jgi:AAA domain
MSCDRGSRILIVEGVPGVGKSTLVDQLLRRFVASEPIGRLRTVIGLAQTHTYGPLAPREDNGTLTTAENAAHLERIVSTLEWLAAHARGQSRVKTFVVVDTLHLTHCLRPGVVQWQHVTTFDARLAALGCKLLLLDATDDTIQSRSVVARADTEFIRGYALGRFGRNQSELVDHFCRERDKFRAMITCSAMLTLTLDAEDAPDELVDAASRFGSPRPGCEVGRVGLVRRAGQIADDKGELEYRQRFSKR